MISGDRIILASASPRRRELLKEAGIAFEAVSHRVDESLFSTENIDPASYAEKLALAKAGSVSGEFPRRLIAGADTIVDCGGKIIGKPEDAEDAERIIRLLFSRPHDVITGVALVCPMRKLEVVRSDRTRIYPYPGSDTKLREHIAGGSWAGKAGAYAVQEGGDKFIERFEGSFSNVIGMPMELFQLMLDTVADHKF